VKEKGRMGEFLAMNFLKEKGYEVVSQNFNTSFGEIDLIVKKGKILVFVEVKAFEKDAVYALEKVDYKKRQKILKIAEYFLLKNSEISDKIEEIRFDVVIVNLKNGDITHYESAFAKA